MATASCPCSGCDYEGEPSSVEAHVSACTDEPHKGKVGRDLRDEIQGGVALADDDRADADAIEGALQVADEEASEEVAEEDAEGGEASDEDEPDDEVADEVAGGDVPAEAAAGAAAVGGGSLLMESDWDVSGTTVAAGVAVVVALILAWAYLRQSDGTSSASGSLEEPDEEESDEMQIDGGLTS